MAEIFACGGCGKIVGVREHPYALTTMFGPAPNGTKPEDTGAAFIRCPTCRLLFVRCVSCGAQVAAEQELQLHYRDRRTSCEAEGTVE